METIPPRQGVSLKETTLYQVSELIDAPMNAIWFCFYTDNCCANSVFSMVCKALFCIKLLISLMIMILKCVAAVWLALGARCGQARVNMPPAIATA